jgi:hypothetical protein
LCEVTALAVRGEIDAAAAAEVAPAAELSDLAARVRAGLGGGRAAVVTPA